VLGSGKFDLYSVVLHEAGLVCGLPENQDPSSVMETYYLGPRTGLGASDVTGIQALYGARPADPYGVAAGTDPRAQSTPLSLVSSSNGVLAVGVDAQLNAAGDQDNFSFQAPSLTGGLVITLQRAGTSLLTPQVTVYNSAGQVVGSAGSIDPTGGDLVINLKNVAPLSTYYVTVRGASGDVFDEGSYHLQVQSLPVVNSLLNTLTSTAGSAVGTVVDTAPLNSTFLTARTASPLSAGNQVDYSFRGTLLVSGQAGYYLVQAPSAASGDNVMTVMAWGVGKSQLRPQVTVYDAQQQVVPAQVLVNEAGTIAVQVANVTPGASYYVKVSGPANQGLLSVGDYFLGVNFVPLAVQWTTQASGHLTAQAPTQQGQLTVERSAVWHFVIGANSGTGTGVMLTITDASGRVVGQVSALDGQSVSLTLTLTAGTYFLAVKAFRTDNNPITPVDFLLDAEMLTDPTGPQSTNTTTTPSSSPSGSTSSSSSPPPSSSYYTYNWSGSSSSGPSSSDPYSSGYTA
jgi:hypothetical protein